MKIFCRKGGGLIVSLPFRRRCFCSPPRGGRRQINTFDRQFSIFLLTPREGGDQLTLFSRVSLNLFLLTPPRGGRRSPAPVCTHAGYHFYSRPAWGATIQKRFHVIIILFISTHAPVWGATPFYLKPRPAEADFYSRPRVGGDGDAKKLIYGNPQISTHAPE